MIMEEINKSGLTLGEAQGLVDASIQDVKDGFVATGYYLWLIREERLWEEAGYNSFQEFLYCQYQKDKSWASRCIGLFEQFGKRVSFGELPVLAAPYRDYSVSQLIEMLSMAEDQREQVTPDMKVREIRELKPKREKKAGGQKETRPGEGDQLPGKISIEDYLAPVATVATDGQPDEEPDGGVACQGGLPRVLAGGQEGTSGGSGEKGKKNRLKGSGGKAQAGKPMAYDRNLLGQMISEAEYEMETLGEYWMMDLPECYTRKAMEIQAYKDLLAEQDAAEVAGPGLEEAPGQSQPQLPVLKNNDQRKEWLKDYKAWGLWYRDEHIDVNYYKFDFDNGSRLIVAEFPQRENDWSSDKYDRIYYHLVEKGKKKYRGEGIYDEKYQDSPTSETELVEYLKKIQKRERGKE